MSLEERAKRESDSKQDETSSPNETNLTKSCNKPILVLINPHSGQGRSVTIYRKKLVTFLNLHQIEHDVFITDSQSRVHDFLQNKSLDELCKYRSIVVISGDGLLFETVNALMTRLDGEKAIKIPIGLVPTGSGNGLAYTLIRQKHNNLVSSSEAIQICCNQIVQDKTSSADLVKIMYNRHKPDESTTIWSFLSLGWGLLADIDIDSEWLRRLGEFRFTLYGLLRCITSVSYKGRLSFKVANQFKKNESGETIQVSKPTKLIESNSTFTMYDNNCNQQSSHDQVNASQDKVPTFIKQFIDDDGDWVHIEDKFACLYAVYQSHVSSVTKFAPKSTLDDQLIYLTYIRGKLNPCKVIKFLLSIEDGSHEHLPYVTVVPVKSFIFQPLEESKVVIDGELVSWNLTHGPITAEVVPKVVNLLWEPNVDGK